MYKSISWGKGELGIPPSEYDHEWANTIVNIVVEDRSASPKNSHKVTFV